MSMFRSGSRGRVAVVTCATALVLTACGGGSSSGQSSAAAGGSTTAGSAAGAAAAVPALGKATIVLGGKVITWAPAYVAVCEGLFKKHGLDVELTVSPQGTTAAIASLVSGDAIASLTGAPAAVSPVREGAPIQLLFNASVGLGIQVVVSNDVLKATGVTPQSPLADRVKALKGQKVAILNPGDSISHMLNYVLPLYGMDPAKDITMVALNSYGPMFAAMKINQIGALAGSPPNGQIAEQQGLGKILFNGNEFPGLSQYPYLVGSANTKEIADHPDRIKALVEGIADSMKLLRTTPDAGKNCLRKQFPDLDQPTFDAAYKFAVASVPDTPLITESNYKALSDFADAGKQPLGVTYDKAVAVGIVKEALAAG